MPKVSAHSFDNPTSFFIGDINESFPSGVLPNNRHVLSVLFYHTRMHKFTVAASAKDVASKLMLMYAKARIPTVKVQTCISRITKLHRKYMRVSSNMRTRSQRQTDLERQFLSELEELFEIALPDDMIRDNKARKYLLEQRSNYSRPTSLKTVRFDDSINEEFLLTETDKQIPLKRKAANESHQKVTKKKAKKVNKKQQKPAGKKVLKTRQNIVEKKEEENGGDFDDIQNTEINNNSPKKHPKLEEVIKEEETKHEDTQNTSIFNRSCVIS